MKIEVSTTTITKEVVDVQFPIYRNHSLDHSHIYTRITRGPFGFIVHEIHVSHDGTIELSVDDNYRFGCDRREYLLGEGEFESNEKEFNDALAAAAKVLGLIQGGSGISEKIKESAASLNGLLLEADRAGLVPKAVTREPSCPLCDYKFSWATDLPLSWNKANLSDLILSLSNLESDGTHADDRGSTGREW